MGGPSLTSISVWRVLQGPNDDWPLALCDYQSVDLDKDVVSNDCLHAASVGENWLLHANENHRWYYMSGQEEDDLIVFRNIDSEGLLPRKHYTSLTSRQGSQCNMQAGFIVPLITLWPLIAPRGTASRLELLHFGVIHREWPQASLRKRVGWTEIIGNKY